MSTSLLTKHRYTVLQLLLRTLQVIIMVHYAFLFQSCETGSTPRPRAPGTGYPVMKGRCLGLNFRALLLRAGFFRGHLIGISSPILSGFLALKRQSKGHYTILRPQNCINLLKMGQVAMGSVGNRELQTELQ